MPQAGLINTRTKPRVKVLRGYDPNAPMTMTQSLPVTSGSTVASGQVVSQVWTAAQGSYTWTLGATTASAVTPFIALQDSADEDVIEAGKLTGLSCAGQFEIQTAYYQGTSFAPGTFLCASTGTLGSIRAVSTTGDIVLGQVTRNPGAAVGTVSAPTSIFTLSASYTGGTGYSTGPGAIFYPGQDSSAVAPIQVVTFQTIYSGHRLVSYPGDIIG
jgi:hypothetical protein